jgi:hypothetical protein
MRGFTGFGVVGTFVLGLSLVACGPGPKPGDDTGDDDAPPTADAGPGGPSGAISGTVWAPGNAPGMVPAGHEIPVSEAVIYVRLQPPPAIPAGVYCEECQDPPGQFTIADSKGNFTLSGIPAGDYWLVIQKGQFRLDQQVSVQGELSTPLSAAQTTLPSDHDPASGRWLPHIAVGTGSYDDVETIFGKLGIGMVDASGAYVGSSAIDNIDYYDNGGFAGTAGDFMNLVTDLNKMMQYHLIVMPCTSTSGSSVLFDNPVVRQNIVEYVKAGGKWYVADWSSEWADVVWPTFIQFAADHDTATAGCTGTACNDGDGWGPSGGFSSYDSNLSKAEDAKLRDWLNGQMGPLDSTAAVGTINGDQFMAEANYDAINSLGSVQIGTDMNGMAVMETPKVYVTGNWPDATVGHPLTVTYQPGGCGRVLYTTYHTTEYDHVGLMPQERVLLYLIMEIGVCHDGPVVE